MKHRWLFALIVLGGCQGNGQLEVREGWVRAGPPNARMLAAYAVIHNGTANTVELVGYASPQFELVELHETTIEQGVSRMRQIESLPVAPGATATLKPGGLHLMLMRPTSPLDEGVTVTMKTAQGAELVTVLPVRKP